VAAQGAASLTVDLKPDVSETALAAKWAASPRASRSTRLAKAGLSPVAIGLMREAEALPAEPAALARLAKACPVRITGFAGLERAISSAGGVRWAALDSGGMLKERPGVFCAGEMIDWEAPTGGYLLQACFATGAAAARAALDWRARATG
jgi:predicted flavoprotein YhiN